MSELRFLLYHAIFPKQRALCLDSGAKIGRFSGFRRLLQQEIPQSKYFLLSNCCAVVVALISRVETEDWDFVEREQFVIILSSL